MKILLGSLLALALLIGLRTAWADDVPPLAACARGPDGEPIHCRCLYSDPVGLPVDDPADCPEPPPPPSTTVVDCWLPIKFGKGDKLYYINGTETHTGEKEDKIAEYPKAQKNPEGGRVFDHLSLNINGRTIWFAHHGKGRATGANEGNGLIILLRNIYFDNPKRGLASPDMIITGHTHTPAYSVLTVRERENFRMMHAIIAPSWQRKTRYGYKAAPVEVNEIGAVTFDISRSGEISQPKFILMQTGVTAVNSDAI